MPRILAGTVILCSAASLFIAGPAEARKRRFKEDSLVCKTFPRSLTDGKEFSKSDVDGQSRHFAKLGTSFDYRVTLRGRYQWGQVDGSQDPRDTFERFIPDRFALEGNSLVYAEKNPRGRNLYSVTEVRLDSSTTDVNFAFSFPAALTLDWEDNHHTQLVTNYGYTEKGLSVKSLEGSGLNAFSGAAGGDTGLRTIRIRSGVVGAAPGPNGPNAIPYFTDGYKQVEFSHDGYYTSNVRGRVAGLGPCRPDLSFSAGG